MTEQKHSLLSPSSAHRWMKCTASVDLCKDIPREDNEASKKGTAFHELAHEYLTEKLPNVRLPNVLIDNAPGEIREYLRYVWGRRTYQKQKNPANNFYHVEETHYQVCDLPVKYKIFGTADCVLSYTEEIENDIDTVLEIIDLKTGSVPVKAENNPQLMIYAFLVRNIDTLTTYYTKIRLTIVQHQVIDSWELTPGRLRYFAEEVFKIQENIAAGNTEYVLGDHCQYCPAKSLCPKYIQDLKVLDYQFKGIQHLSLDEMQRMILVRKKLNSYLDSIEKELEKKLKGGVVLEDFELRPKRGRRVLTKSEEELRVELRKKDNYEDYLDLKSLTAIEKFDKLFVDENTSYVPGQLGLAMKKVEEPEFEFTALPST